MKIIEKGQGQKLKNTEDNSTQEDGSCLVLVWTPFTHNYYNIYQHMDNKKRGISFLHIL